MIMVLNPDGGVKGVPQGEAAASAAAFCSWATEDVFGKEARSLLSLVKAIEHAVSIISTSTAKGCRHSLKEQTEALYHLWQLLVVPAMKLLPGTDKYNLIFIPDQV